MGSYSGISGMEFVNTPSPVYVATLASHALLTLILRLPATFATLFHRDDPNPSATFVFKLVGLWPSFGDLANSSSANVVVDDVALPSDPALKREDAEALEALEEAEDREEIDSLRDDPR